jgi:hypothetical protein
MSDRLAVPRFAPALTFDAVLTLTPDLLAAHGLAEHGRKAETAARLAVERLPGAVAVRVQWRGPEPDRPTPPLVAVHPLGSTTEVPRQPWRALSDLASASVHAALQALAQEQRRG